VDQVVGDLDAGQCRAQAVGIGDVTVDGLALAVVAVGVAGHRPHTVAGADQRRHEA